MSYQYVIGIDPGLSGAIAVIDSTSRETTVIDMPVISVGKKNTLNLQALCQFLEPYKDKDAICLIEKVGARPGQGVTSMFNFGKSYGALMGILSALRIPYTEITPQSWKKVMMAGQPKEKDASRYVAQQLFPDQDLSRKKDHGRADALLLAEYGIRQLVSAETADVI
jgi:crossover junction endodeoxyribonuclease RuvC